MLLFVCLQEQWQWHWAAVRRVCTVTVVCCGRPYTRWAVSPVTAYGGCHCGSTTRRRSLVCSLHWHLQVQWPTCKNFPYLYNGMSIISMLALLTSPDFRFTFRHRCSKALTLAHSSQMAICISFVFHGVWVNVMVLLYCCLERSWKLVRSLMQTYNDSHAVVKLNEDLGYGSDIKKCVNWRKILNWKHDFLVIRAEFGLADVNNIGKYSRDGGSCTAAAFLRVCYTWFLIF